MLNKLKTSFSTPPSALIPTFPGDHLFTRLPFSIRVSPYFLCHTKNRPRLRPTAVKRGVSDRFRHLFSCYTVFLRIKKMIRIISSCHCARRKFNRLSFMRCSFQNEVGAGLLPARQSKADGTASAVAYSQRRCWLSARQRKRDTG